ncbi:MAG: VanW family protein [Oscillospiraceae bacterium]|nr:VanW family protein [Oscillospiraceae bacterium]
MKALSLLLALLLLLGSLPAHADEAMPQAVYMGKARAGLTVRADMHRDAPALGGYRQGQAVYITAYAPEWLTVVIGDEEDFATGYVLRHMVEDIQTLLPGAPPYGTVENAYVARVAEDTLLRAQPDAGAAVLCGLPAGSRVAIQSLENGWAKIPYWRQEGYVYVGALADLTPIYPAETALPGDVLSAFVTFYSEADDALNQSRMGNIIACCGYINQTIPSGMRFDFDGIAAPYSRERGYGEAIAFYDGRTGTGMGGGVCQVSSTLYNALLPLGDGIDILMRRPHGPSGATYLPHGVDAAVGRDTLNLIFRNTYGFAVRIEAEARHGVVYTALVRE